jgi:hypothetical protein
VRDVLMGKDAESNKRHHGAVLQMFRCNKLLPEFEFLERKDSNFSTGNDRTLCDDVARVYRRAIDAAAIMVELPRNVDKKG